MFSIQTSVYQNIFNDLNNSNPELSNGYKKLFHEIILKCDALQEENIVLQGRVKSCNANFAWVVKEIKSLKEATLSNKKATISHKKETLDTKKKCVRLIKIKEKIDRDQQRILKESEVYFKTQDELMESQKDIQRFIRAVKILGY